MKKMLLFVTALLAAGGAAAADPQMIVYVNYERIYQESKIVQQVHDSIRVVFQERENALREQDKKIRALRGDLEKETLTLSDAERGNKSAEIVQLERRFGRERQALLEDRGAVAGQRRRQIDGEIDKVIKALASERNYLMIINPYLVLPLPGNQTLTHNIILFADAKADITADVVARFDEQTDASLFN